MSDIFADEIADPCDDCGAAAGVMCDCVMVGIMGPKRNYSRGDIVTYHSPSRGHVVRVKLGIPIAAPDDGTPAWDCTIINAQGEPDIATYFFTSAWCKESQIIGKEG